uniref:Disease resistance protein At4g27190-like leucine-rich repeats domain-containing protein n=1 Tax=Chenopodium quinoa TaxID=63459 RepID=A0A803MK58_CHEQI
MALIIRNWMIGNTDVDEELRLMRSKNEALRAQAADVNTQLEAEEMQPGRKRMRQVENWLKSVEELEAEVGYLEQDVEKGQFSSRKMLKRDIVSLTQEMDDLMEQGNFPGGLTLDDHASSSVPLVTSKLKEGIGKTTLAMHIHNKLHDDVKTSSDKTAKAAKVDHLLEGETDQIKRAAVLSNALKKRKKVVLFLDDMWKHFEMWQSWLPKCASLPLGILTIAGSIREVIDIHEWNDTLEELSDPTRHHDDMETDVFPILELNSLLENIESREKQLDKGHTFMNRLINASLLESLDSQGKFVKMHDLIRDMAIKIGSNTHHFLIRSRLQLTRVPNVIEWTTEDLVKSSASSSELELQSLKELNLSELASFKVITVDGKPPSGALNDLKKLTMEYCSKIEALFTPSILNQLRNLEVLEVQVCEALKEIVSLSNSLEDAGNVGNQNDTSTSMIYLPKLRILQLIYLPNLVTICLKRLLGYDHIEDITIIQCPLLEKLPLSLPLLDDGQPYDAPLSLRKIVVEKEWWEILEWDNPDSAYLLRPLIEFTGLS